MRKPFGVTRETYSGPDHCIAKKHFYDNAVLRTSDAERTVDASG